VYLSSYLLVVPAILVGFGAASVLRRARGLLDAFLIAVGVGGAGWQVLIGPQLGGAMTLAAATSIAYPLLGLVIVACVAAVGVGGHRGLNLPMRLTGIAFTISAVTDTCYTYATVLHSYVDGSWLNIGWQSEAVLLALAALAAARSRHQEALVAPIDRDVTFVPVALCATALCVIVGVDQARDGRVSPATMIIAAVLLGGLLARQWMATRDRTVLARQLQNALAEQERLAVTDSLTGLYNRRFFDEMLRLEGERCARAGDPIGVILIDLDHFKQINDSYGHPVGDVVLTQTADRIRNVVRASDIVARYGGEEFICLLPSTSEESALDLAARIRTALRSTPITGGPGQYIAVRASLGVAVWQPDQPAGTLARLVTDADRALYQAKASGRDRVESAHRPHPSGVDDDVMLPEALLWMADHIDRKLGAHEHSTAVARWCLLLAQQLGLDLSTIRRTAAAGRLHDIGKIAVDDAILRKPSHPTDAEWAQLRCHPDEGGRLLANLGHDDLAPLVAAHHERYDGTGYPAGLTGEAIPIEARIIAVCDSWAAMCADRPYAPAMKVQQARTEILNGRQTQFDPIVADAFLNLVDTGQIDDPAPLHSDSITVP
jgi:diguanylate cyclase (GGDEF)-like protein